MSIIDQIAFDQIADERDKAQQENKLLKQRIKRLEEERTKAAANSLANMISYEAAINKIEILQEAGDGLAKMVERDYATTGFTEPWRKAKGIKL